MRSLTEMIASIAYPDAARVRAVPRKEGTERRRRGGQGFRFTPLRSAGGHRRYSRYQLRLAARAREMVDQGTALESACRIIVLEDQLEEALRLNDQSQQPRHSRQTDPQR